MDESDHQPPITLSYEPIQERPNSLPWPAKLARIGVAAGYALLPVHLFVPCVVSSKVGGCAIVLLAVSAVLALIVGYYRLAALAAIGLFTHPMLIH